ncbi:MAG TPA: phosphoribosyltransferase family protein [Miltoncostaea sp.]|nr:phosphoribosyltransferase family protein [Miltoncostaea sp.]
MGFRDREDAGRRLAALLRDVAGDRAVVLGVPRGGVPVAAEVARELAAPLDVVVVRKVGAPAQPELAIGAVAEGGVALVDRESARRAGVAPGELEGLLAGRRAEVDARVRALRGDVPARALDGATAIIVDDGLATGLSDLAAVASARGRGAGRVIVAAPVGSEGAVALVGAEADECVCALVPRRFGSVGRWYGDFAPVPDEEVRALLARQPR